MSLIKRDPFRDLDRLEEMFLGQGREAGFDPSVDIHETENDVSIEAELPGMTKKDIHVEVADQQLKISGERKYERQDDKAHRIERRYGRFERSFYLGEDVDPSSVSAEMNDGILKLSMKKKEKAKPKQIDVK
jgi:HSP20 family protein